MKKIFKFLLMAAVAGIAIVACNKPNTPAKENDKGKDEGQDQKEEAKLAIDGKFDEWESVTAVAGDADYGLLLMKAQMDDNKLYFYMEVDAQDMCMEESSYSNYLTLYLDCGKGGSEKISYWGGEEGCSYDVHFSIWLMQETKANMANWDKGFAGKAKIVDGIYKAEFCLGRTSDDEAVAEALKAKAIYFGAALTDQYVEHPKEGEEEGQWMGGEEIGLAPAMDEDMAPIKIAR